MQKAETEEEFRRLLAEHDRLTDADGKPRMLLRTLEAFRHGPANLRTPEFAAPGITHAGGLAGCLR